MEETPKNRVIKHQLQEKLDSLKPPFEYEIVKPIGHGKDPVYLAIRKDTTQEVAVKKIKFRSNSESAPYTWDELVMDTEHCANQYLAISNVKHPHIMEHMGLELEKSDGNITGISLIMEYCSGGTLLSKSKATQGLDELLVIKYAGQIISGLLCIHQAGICHLDLKGENILLTYDDTIKIGDFGELVKLQSATQTRSNEVSTDVGTLRYCAPEMVNPDHARRGRAADIYSFGCVLIEMLTGEMPRYRHDTSGYLQDRWQLTTFIGNGGRPDFKVDSVASEDLQKLLRQCLNLLPQLRPTALEVVKLFDSWREEETDSKRLYPFIKDHYVFERWSKVLPEDLDTLTDTYNVLVIAASDTERVFLFNLLFNQNVAAHDGIPGGFYLGHDNFNRIFNQTTRAYESRRVVVAAIPLPFDAEISSVKDRQTTRDAVKTFISSNLKRIDAVFAVMPEDFLEEKPDGSHTPTYLTIQSLVIRFINIENFNFRHYFFHIGAEAQWRAASGTTLARLEQETIYAQTGSGPHLICGNCEADADERKVIEDTWEGIKPLLRLKDRNRIAFEGINAHPAFTEYLKKPKSCTVV